MNIIKLLERFVSALRHGEAYIDGLVEYCSVTIANALEKLQSCTKISMCVSEQFQQGQATGQTNVD